MRVPSAQKEGRVTYACAHMASDCCTKMMSTSDRYTCQSRTVAGGSLLSVVASLCAFGVGMWLLIYSQDFVEVIGVPLWDAFAGYSVLAVVVTITGMVGVCVSLAQSNVGLLCFAVFLSSNALCQGIISAYLFTETREVMGVMNDTIAHVRHCRTFTTMAYKFHCELETVMSLNEQQCRLDDDESDSTELDSCAASVNSWLERGVWSAIAMAAILMAFQILLVITSLMLRHMLVETDHYTGGCLSRQRHFRTAPITLIDVTPATTPAPHESHDMWGLDDCPLNFVQGFSPHPLHAAAGGQKS